MPIYRVRGTTDEVTQCQLCGKPELKGTVVLDILDADGNTAEVTYAGSTCAAKAAGSRADKIRSAARYADEKREIAVYYARVAIRRWEPVEHDRAAIREKFFSLYPDARGCVSSVEWVAKTLAAARDTIATGGLSAIRND